MAVSVHTDQAWFSGLRADLFQLLQQVPGQAGVGGFQIVGNDMLCDKLNALPTPENPSAMDMRLKTTVMAEFLDPRDDGVACTICLCAYTAILALWRVYP